MRSDTLLFQFFNQFPEAAFEIFGFTDLSPADYRFEALTVKELPLYADGAFLTNQPDKPQIFLEVYFYKYPPAYRKLILEALHYQHLTEPTPEIRTLLIFANRKLDAGDKMLEILKQTPYLNVIYLDEELNKNPRTLFHTLLEIIVFPDNEKEDLRKVQEVYRELREIQPNYIELCVHALAEKYKYLTFQQLKSMIDPTKPFHPSESRWVREYAQEYAQECTQELVEKNNHYLFQLKSTARSLKEKMGLSNEAVANIMSISLEEVEDRKSVV